MNFPNPFKSKELDTVTIESYQHVLSEKTRALMELDRQKRELEAKETRKSQLIAEIAEASNQIDSTDSDAESIKGNIATLQRELDQLESSLSKEQKRVYSQAQKLLNDRIELAKKFNALITEAENIWQQLSIEPSNEEMLLLRTAFDISKPVDLGFEFDFNFGTVPQFAKYPDANQVITKKRSDKHPNAL